MPDTAKVNQNQQDHRACRKTGFYRTEVVLSRQSWVFRGVRDAITQELMKFRDRYPTTGTGPLYTSSVNLRTAASRVPYIYSSHICSPGK